MQMLFLATFIVFHYYLAFTSVEYTCLYMKLYQWSVSGHDTMGKKSWSLWDVGQLSKSGVLQNFLSIDAAAKTLYLLNVSAVFLYSFLRSKKKKKKVV